MIIEEIVLATTNQGKVRELREMLADCCFPIKSLSDYPAAGEAEETGKTFAENARQKALYYGRRLQTWVLADDSGLEIDALNGEPGVYSARYAGAEGERAIRDKANWKKVLKLLNETPEEKRTARFRCCLCLACGDEVVLEVDGVLEGRIGYAPQGSNGFGYDPIMYIPAKGKTVAEMNSEEKNAISHRGRALAKMQEAIRRLQ